MLTRLLKPRRQTHVTQILCPAAPQPNDPFCCVVMAAGVLGVAVRKTLPPDLFCATGELDLAGNFTVPAAGLQQKLRAAIHNAGSGVATVFVPQANLMDDGTLQDHDTKDGTTSQVHNIPQTTCTAP